MDTDMDMDSDFAEDTMKVSNRIDEEVLPVLDRIEDDYPDHSAYFAVFINAIHMLFYQGWTKEDLLNEIEEHHVIHLQDEFESSGGQIH